MNAVLRFVGHLMGYCIAGAGLVASLAAFIFALKLLALAVAR